jgi:hypothetical protein
MSYGSRSIKYLAPGATAVHSMHMPGHEAHQDLYTDEHVVTPETREELIDGQVVHALPAEVPHGDRHFRLDYVLAAHLAPGYEGSTDLLTRTSEGWNFAADASVRKAGVHPDTGRRHLEELAFEVKHTQAMSDLTRRARQLIDRGVRRVFVICVERGKDDSEVIAGPVLEWSTATRTWIELDPDSAIEDTCLSAPLAVRALLDAAETDNQVARALLAKGNPVLRAREQQINDQGKAEGIIEGIIEMCELIDVQVTLERRQQLASMSVDELRQFRSALKAGRQWPGQ